MLAQLSRQRRALQQLGPLAVAGCAALQQSGSLQQSRGMSMRIFEVGCSRPCLLPEGCQQLAAG